MKVKGNVENLECRISNLGDPDVDGGAPEIRDSRFEIRV